MASLLLTELPETILQVIARRATEANRSLQEEIRLALVRAYRDPRLTGQQVWVELQREKLLRGQVPRAAATLSLLRDIRRERDDRIVAGLGDGR